MRGRRGQALVVGSMLLVLVCAAVLVTLHVGKAAEERVRLQDTADAAAYSMATLEARTFNLYAYANRAQASHYASAMLLQSFLSFLYFDEAFLTDAYGVMRTLDPCAAKDGGIWGPVCRALEALPGIGPALQLLNGAFALFEGLVVAYQHTLRASSLDERIGTEAIPAVRTASSAMAAISTALMQSTLEELASGAESVIARNDPRLGPASAYPTALSVCMFDRAHVREANGSPLAPSLRPGHPIRPRALAEDDRRARAKRVMAQVANASRYGCDGGSPRCAPAFATSRTADQILFPEWLAPASAMLRAIPKWGQTRLLTHGLGRGDDDPEGGNLVREPADAPGAGMAMLAQGEVLGSDDLYSIRLGPPSIAGVPNPFSCGPASDPSTCWGDPRHKLRADRPHRFMLKTSIWAGGEEDPVLAGGGLHWRVAYPGYPRGRGWAAPTAPGQLGRMGLNVVHRTLGGIAIPIYVANVRPVRDGNHPWRGVAPFMHFEPGQFEQACGEAGGDEGARIDEAARRRAEFNQPSAWIFLEAPPDVLRGPGAGWPWLLGESGAFAPGRGRLELGSRPGSSRSPGPRAFARAQVYYHRPGNWSEPPNFFNPYWRARLAATWQGRDAFPPVRELAGALPEPLRASPQKAITH